MFKKIFEKDLKEKDKIKRLFINLRKKSKCIGKIKSIENIEE